MGIEPVTFTPGIHGVVIDANRGPKTVVRDVRIGIEPSNQPLETAPCRA